MLRATGAVTLTFALAGSALPAATAAAASARPGGSASPVTAATASWGSSGQSSFGASAATAAHLQIGRDTRGRTHFVGAQAGQTVRRPAGVSATASAATKARAHLGRFGSLFGVHDPAANLRTDTVDALGHGQSVVRFQQTARGLPVLGGQLATVVDARGNLISLSGETSPRVTSSAFPQRAAAARGTALSVTARDTRVGIRRLRATAPARWLYDASLFANPGKPGARGVWLVTVTAPARADVRELVLVDAVTGKVVLHVNQAPHLDQVVCDNANKKKDDYTCAAGRYKRDTSADPADQTDTASAYRATRAASDFYASLGVDLTALIGSDYGDGKKIRSTVGVCPSTGCPYDNAFWDGFQMVYGRGFPRADDVVAHELTHGVTQHTSGLIYWFQSGAINESMSDVFGEFIDQTDGIGNDSPAVRWQLGEDLPFANPVTRDMANPLRFGQPDQVRGPDWVSKQDGDSGGVHTNSGVGNKAAYLITDGTTNEPGGTFGGQAFAGLGVDKAKWIYWVTETMLTPGADYGDLASTLYGACSALASSGTAGITAADCDTTVRGATAATRMGDFVGPSAPQNVKVYGGYREIRGTWAPPADQGTSPISSYVLIVTPAIDGENFLPIEDPTLRDVVIGGIPAGHSYTFALSAVSGDGSSPPVARTLQGTSLSLVAPKSAVYGGRTRLSGRLTSRARLGVAGRTVKLYRKLSGASSYRLLSRGRTSANGSYAFRVKVVRRATYYVAYPASSSTAFLGSHSRTRTVPVRQRVTFAASATSVRVGRAVRFTGRVTPQRSGTVTLQRSGGRTWTPVLRDRLDRSGRYRLTVVPRSSKDYAWRVVVASTRAHQAGVSRVQTVRVA
ncbi:MAG: M4 family metallopeptidase [Actinomycetes bacterium]